jgi:hypothetical protein
MTKENKQTQANAVSPIIEDLTLNETETANIKGGPSDYLLEIDGIIGESSTRHLAGRAGYDLQTNKKL